MKHVFVLFLISLAACGGDGTSTDNPDVKLVGGKADEFSEQRVWDVRILDPHCDVCDPDDKAHLLENSPIISKVLEMIDGAENTIDVAQFTFSRKEIEAALVAAHERGVTVRLAMNKAQESQGDNVSNRLKSAGLDVRFIEGKDNGKFTGLQHAKFMVVDGDKLLFGSNNWSSTGTSFNDENTMTLSSNPDDPILASFRCAFTEMFASNIDAVGACESEEVGFTPGTGPWKRIREEIRTSESTIDVLMHHLVFSDAVKELAKAAERGVRVRIVVNAADRDEIKGGNFERLMAAGGEVRFKQTNVESFQIMHHKLAIIDGRTLLNGSGNWSGSAFFNNYEFYTRLTQPEVVIPFKNLFTRLWNWSLNADALDRGLTAAEQDAEVRTAFFGNLHAHFHHDEADHAGDDGKLERDVAGEIIDISDELAGRSGARFALEYARDRGGLDFMALSPHTMDPRPDDQANMSDDGYAAMLADMQEVNNESSGQFVALRGFEWSTNSTGNHVNVIGSSEIANVERGAFVDMYEGFLPTRTEANEAPILMFNHPRTFRGVGNETLNGAWDQIFGVNLQDITSNSDRTKKFNDYGLDDYSPLKEVLPSWIAGETLPDEAVVAQTLLNIAEVTEPYARIMEVTVNRGTDLASEVAQNPSMTEDPETMEVGRFVKVHTDWDYYLLNGFKLAPVASHDNHFANWGTGHTSRTVVHAETLTEADLMAALGERAVFASEDQNLDIRYYADDRIRAGETMRTLDNSVTLQWTFSDPDFDDNFEVTIWAGTLGGEMREVATIGEVAGDEWHTFDVALPDVGKHFFYLEVFEPGPDRMAWTAPIWIEREK